MLIEVKGRNCVVTDELHALVERRFRRVANQVAEVARMEVELTEERNPAIARPHVAEVTLYLKGTTLRVHEASYDMPHAVNLCAEELSRQVKRHRDKRRHRRDARAVREDPVRPAA
ncbi:MAG: ribosome-associated translation inhibitor RaiA [Solirubrobacterales bacterium]|nr:ribosome-associated translation inhibitor RaiA [Solirubrobacterales bacterium]